MLRSLTQSSTCGAVPPLHVDRSAILAIQTFAAGRPASLTSPAERSSPLRSRIWCGVGERYSIVGCLSVTGCYASQRIGINPLDGLDNTVTRGLLGGNGGDIAARGAARRLELMPFAHLLLESGSVRP